MALCSCSTEYSESIIESAEHCFKKLIVSTSDGLSAPKFITIHFVWFWALKQRQQQQRHTYTQYTHKEWWSKTDELPCKQSNRISDEFSTCSKLLRFLSKSSLVDALCTLYVCCLLFCSLMNCSRDDIPQMTPLSCRYSCRYRCRHHHQFSCITEQSNEVFCNEFFPPFGWNIFTSMLKLIRSEMKKIIEIKHTNCAKNAQTKSTKICRFEASAAASSNSNTNREHLH